MRSSTTMRPPLPGPQRQKYSLRPLKISIFILCGLASLSLLISSRRHQYVLDLISPARQLRRLDEREANENKVDHECRFVRMAVDKCAFVRANCPNEEAGLLSYLQFYYCRLPHLRPLAFVVLVFWLGLLFSTIGIAASDFFCINLSTISTLLGMSESMAGVTFLALGNGSPDVFSTFAAMSTHSGSLAIGELIGAAGFITAVVAGSMALVRPFKVARKSFVRDVSFFIVAASFSMVFIADGYLALWECAVMVGFYGFYVFTVVVWHWYLGRQKRRKVRDMSARTHYIPPDDGDAEANGQSFNEAAAVSQSVAVARVNMGDNPAVLKTNANAFREACGEDEADDMRDSWMAEISRNMRLKRPATGERRTTGNPIRPSLVGALEFRSVLSSLERIRKHQTIPINLRRHSDDPTLALSSQQHNLDEVGGSSISQLPDHLESLVINDTSPRRYRARSANDAVAPKLLPKATHQRSRPRTETVGLTPAPTRNLALPANLINQHSCSATVLDALRPSAPTFTLSVPLENDRADGESSDTSTPRPSPHPNLLVGTDAGFDLHDHQFILTSAAVADLTPASSIGIHHRQTSTSSFNRSTRTMDSSPVLSFPSYHDDPNFSATSSRSPSIRLPPPSVSTEPLFCQSIRRVSNQAPIFWWPHKILPARSVLISTLFPTLYSWEDKNTFERILGIVAAPSVFLLAITLPVVEADKADEIPSLVGSKRLETVIQPSARSRPDNNLKKLSANATDGGSNGVSAILTDLLDTGHHHGQKAVKSNAELGPVTTNGRATWMETDNHSTPSAAVHTATNDSSFAHLDSSASTSASPKDWNRWLVSTQVFTAPLFLVLVVWLNSDSRLLIRNLLVHVAYTMVGSLFVFAIILHKTTETKPPPYRHLLCFIGFIVSIAWISTIANEVVGVLKAIGVILGISDAILGLTIFAVGNSLGDLVADITVARLGFPVMALSACFGGPMLNILLGIGLSGLYMTIHEAQHDPSDRFTGSKPYQIEVGGTLLISGITLLITLVGLLIAVPINNWVMDRKIGWGLVILWCISTLGNVVVESTDWGADLP